MPSIVFTCLDEASTKTKTTTTMDRTDRPLTKRLRASLACNGCRQTKSKCDGARPICERCTRNGASCVYSQSGQDKRMQRQDERRANLALMSRVKELEAKLAALSPSCDEIHVDKASVTNSEGSADAIATGLFDHPPANDTGYFGSSSNHAFFFSLSTSIENVSRRDGLGQEPARHMPPPDPPLALAPPPMTDRPGDDSFPELKVAVAWVMRFFHTVGAVVIYLDESDILAEIDAIGPRGWQSRSPSSQALLSIIFAHALNTLEERSPEPFYRRALSLLDDKAVHNPTICALQALLLTSRFQQNTQRSMESWAPHYLAVRVSYQLGIHAPASYKHLSIHDKELRSRLWYAVVNQDRILTASLARPCLIPLQHVQGEISDFLDAARPGKSTEMNCSEESVAFFRRNISLHQILGATVDSIYSSNINMTSRLPLGDLLAKTMDLVWKLDEWRQNKAPAEAFVSAVDMGQWPAEAFQTQRFNIVTTIFFSRTQMLIHGGLLMRVLERVSGTPDQDASSTAVHDASLSLLRNYLRDLQQWLSFIEVILNHERSFLTCNAVWWTSNYMMVSTCIHAFAFWLLADEMRSSSLELEQFLRSALDTLKRVGGSSIMSRKAHRCMERYLHCLKSIRASGTDCASVHSSVAMSDQTEGAAAAAVAAAAAALPPMPVVTPQWNAGVAPEVFATGGGQMDVFGGMGQVDLMYTGFLGMEQAISDYDAAGFV
ncbi:hypothetical protein L249_1854 [Ophiocordyceps polyrhachis-furcata BCC 54312]|uniref:Zn(2)-C6 fungal-type domain-containing protein n=1 Tax=Ophiocordyceps polyrhachis-furcata BCC 54312 TaxID=1330021 RepID=A0A367LPH4_9HYPO|nr:hypothetical protein L249_1854 [Ophiocordyceps polyrhachis-furcata BCC 54312]